MRPSFCSNARPTDQKRDKDHKLCTYHGLSPELHPWAILSNISCVCGDFMSILFFVAVLHLSLQSIYPFSPTYKILGHGVKDVLHHGQDGNLSSISYYFVLLCCLCFLQFLLLLVVLLQLISLPLCVFAIVMLSFIISFWLISVSCCFVIQYTFSDKPIKHFILIHDSWSWVTT